MSDGPLRDLAAEATSYLNELFVLDPLVGEVMLERKPCPPAVADHDDVVLALDEQENQLLLSPLGILNGLLRRRGCERLVVFAYAEDGTKLGFAPIKPVWSEDDIPVPA